MMSLAVFSIFTPKRFRTSERRCQNHHSKAKAEPKVISADVSCTQDDATQGSKLAAPAPTSERRACNALKTLPSPILIDKATRFCNLYTFLADLQATSEAGPHWRTQSGTSPQHSLATPCQRSSTPPSKNHKSTNPSATCTPSSPGDSAG